MKNTWLSTVKYLFSGESFCPDFPKKRSFFPENKNPGPENQALQLKVFFPYKSWDKIEFEQDLTDYIA